MSDITANTFDIKNGDISISKNEDKAKELKQQFSEEDVKRLQEEFKKETERLQNKFKIVSSDVAETIQLEDISPEEAKLILDDKEDLYAFTELMDGIGLSASQMGINKKYFVARDMSLDGNPFKIYFNPKYYAQSDARKVFTEGCLTYPGQQFNIKRWKNIIFHWYGFDENGNWKKFQKSINGLNSVILQHETMHCAGHPGSDGKTPLTIMTMKHRSLK